MKDGGLSPTEVRKEIQERMSRNGAFLRTLSDAVSALADARRLYNNILHNGLQCNSRRELAWAVGTKWLALASVAFLQAIVSYIERGGGSRGAYMVLDENGDLDVQVAGKHCLRHRSENMSARKEILELSLRKGTECDFEVAAVPVRPLPTDDSWFENTWADFANGRIFRSGI